MKNILTIITVSVITSVIFFVSGVSVFADENGHVDLETALPQILEKYDVKNIEDLDCDQISDEDLEFVGDAWMETAHPGEAHIIMDRMMGGEGSDTLRAAHIQMGQNYLGCGSYQEMMGQGMMRGGGMMNDGMGMMSGNSNYQKNYYNNFFGSWSAYLIPLTLLSMFAFFTSGTYFFIRRVNNKK